MKASRDGAKKAKKRKAASTIDEAVLRAFQELSDRAAQDAKVARDERRGEKYQQWQGAAKRFKGISEALRLRLASRNISFLPDGYIVKFKRDGKNFVRRFAGTSEDSLSAAVKFRDEAAKILGEQRTPVPTRVLKILGLSQPVPGITRNVPNSAYVVTQPEARKSGKRRAFSFKYLAEEDAYAAAIECLEAALQAK